MANDVAPDTAPGPSGGNRTSADWAAYHARLAELVAAYAALPPDAKVRLRKRTSNLFRPRAKLATPLLDVSGFDGVIEVDPVARTADVQGMTTYEHLLDVTLAHGLAPLVVPQLKTITLGGAVTGLGIESTSFRSGLPHESVVEIDVLTGDGRVVTATRDNEHADLFFGFPNSYGSLGYATRLRIELEEVHPYVALRHVRFPDAPSLFAAMADACASRSYDGRPADFVDATAFSGAELYLTLGSWADQLPPGVTPSDYTGMDVYYRSIQSRHDDILSARDYYWRWDTDWFWCSRAFGAQNPRIRRWWPKRYLRSDAYWKLIALENRFRVVERVDRRRGKPEQERVIQDIEVPIARAAEFLAWFEREVAISPVWACPLRQRNPADVWDLYPLNAATTYVNLGFWSSVDLAPGETDGTYNRRIERKVLELDGRKSLYSTSFFEEEEFWRIYGGDAYAKLRERYDPAGRLTDLYLKAVRRA